MTIWFGNCDFKRAVSFRKLLTCLTVTGVVKSVGSLVTTLY